MELGFTVSSLDENCHPCWKHGKIRWWCVCVGRCNQKPPPPDSECDDDEEEQYESSGFCGMLLDKNGPFAACHKKINPNVSENSFFKWNKLLIWQNTKEQEAIFQKGTSFDTDKKWVLNTYLLFRITLKTVSLTCVSWVERGPSCAKPLKLMSMSVRTAESPLALGEMKPSAVSFSLLQYEGKKQTNNWTDFLHHYLSDPPAALECDSNSHYEPCADPCQETCTGKPPFCHGHCSEGCVCDPGYVLNNGKCVLKTTCNPVCTFNGQTYEVQWSSAFITMDGRCTSCVLCLGPKVPTFIWVRLCVLAWRRVLSGRLQAEVSLSPSQCHMLALHLPANAWV